MHILKKDFCYLQQVLTCIKCLLEERRTGNERRSYVQKEQKEKLDPAGD